MKKKSKQTLLIWTEGDQYIGLGLVVRMLALAQELKKENKVVFFVNQNKHVVAMVEKAGFSLHAFRDMSKLTGKQDVLSKLKPSVIVTDIKEPQAGLFQELKEFTASKIVTFDELNGVRLYSDVVINYNTFNPKREFVSDLAVTQYYFGPKYAILRDEFSKVKKKPFSKGLPKHVFVAFGGSDKLALTVKTARSLSTVKRPLDVTYVLGAAFPFRKELDRELKSFPHKYQVFQDIKNISKLINESDLVITAGATTMYESIFLRKPVITMALAAHQDEFASQLHRAGAVIHLGMGDQVSDKKLSGAFKRLCQDADRRKEIIDQGRLLLDGKGIARIVKIIKKVGSSPENFKHGERIPMKDKKIVATIEARMTSSRLPGKILKAVCGKPLLEHLVDRVRQSKWIDEVVVATTVNRADDAVEAWAKNAGISFFRGSEEDVLLRVLEAAKAYQADLIVELTGDCPLLDPAIIDRVIDLYLTGDFDYVSNNKDMSFPRGMDTQIFAKDLLARVESLTKDPADREHVSLYIYEKEGFCKLGHVSSEPSFKDRDWRLCVDTQEDLEVITDIFTALYRPGALFHLPEIATFLEAHPDIATKNVMIQQKKVR